MLRIASGKTFIDNEQVCLHFLCQSNRFGLSPIQVGEKVCASWICQFDLADPTRLPQFVCAHECPSAGHHL